MEYSNIHFFYPEVTAIQCILGKEKLLYNPDHLLRSLPHYFDISGFIIHFWSGRAIDEMMYQAETQ